MRRVRLAALASALLVAVAASGCSGGGKPSPQDLTQRPIVTVPAGDPPGALQVTDIVVGSGAEAVDGSTVTVRWVGVAWSTRRAFTSSWEDGQPITFRLGAGRVIAGWDQGIAGMKVGGRRQLVVPPALGYGDRPFGELVANETLVYVVDLTAVA